MNKLIDILKKREMNLRNSLSNSNSLKDAVKVVVNEIHFLSDLNGEYIQSLTKLQARIALELLEATSLSYNLLLQNKTEHDYNEAANKTISDISKGKSLINKNVISGAVGATITGVLTGGPIGLLVGAAVGIFTGAAINFGFPEKFQEHNSLKSEELIKKDRINIDYFISNLVRNFETIDKTLEIYNSQTTKIDTRPTLMDFPELAEYFQYLLGEYWEEEENTPKILAKRIEHVQSLLHGYEIEIKKYDDVSSQEALEFFEFENSMDTTIDTFQTILPAFIMKDKKVLKGRVIKPSK